MKNTPKYFIVEASALPEVFLKVAEAKRLIAFDDGGEVVTVNHHDPVLQVGIGHGCQVQGFTGLVVIQIGLFLVVICNRPGFIRVGSEVVIRARRADAVGGRLVIN